MSLDSNLKKLNAYLKDIKTVQKSHVDVGVISNKLTKKIYDNNFTVAQVAARHEFGVGVPKRSFLKSTFELKQKEVGGFITKDFNLVFERRIVAKQAMGRIGIFARNLVLRAFSTGGFGMWPELAPATVKKKGVPTILVETGTLKQSIQWEVVGVSNT